MSEHRYFFVGMAIAVPNSIALVLAYGVWGTFGGVAIGMVLGWMSAVADSA